MLTDQVKKTIKEHSLKESPKESCGLVIQKDNDFLAFPCRNFSKQTNAFAVHPFDYVSGSAIGEIKAIYHSHFNNNFFSQTDNYQVHLHNIPFIMYFVPKNEFKILNPFKIGTNDCYSTIRNYFINKGLNPTNYKRENDWKDKTPGIIEKNYKKEGFNEVPITDLQKDDVILFKFKRNFAEHFGIYLGNGKFLHH
ncbi:MAG: NlpC/P60 family protein, partial [Nanoarchaeota archaeon]